MLVYAGIDEAGYGPLLGPLCVARTVLVLDDRAGDNTPPDSESKAGPPDIWLLLERAVCRNKRDHANRIAIDDSKRLKANSRTANPAASLLHIERGVLAFTCCSGCELPATDEQLFALLGANHRDHNHPQEANGRSTPPWYDETLDIPLAVEPSSLQVQVARLRHVMEQAGVACSDIACRVIDAGPFNQGVARSGSKAAVNFEQVLRHIDDIWRQWPDDHPRIVVDRLGGRTHYMRDLQQSWPDAEIRILAEEPSFSRYRLSRTRRGSTSAITITFSVEAEDRHFPVALSSMTAKYVRELYMRRLNRFFLRHRPDLRPTAGYVQDGRRFVDQIEPVISTLGLDRTALIRQR